MRSVKTNDLLGKIIEELKKKYPNHNDWDLIQDLLKNQDITLEQILEVMLKATQFDVDTENFQQY